MQTHEAKTHWNQAKNSWAAICWKLLDVVQGRKTLEVWPTMLENSHWSPWLMSSGESHLNSCAEIPSRVKMTLDTPYYSLKVSPKTMKPLIHNILKGLPEQSLKNLFIKTTKYSKTTNQQDKFQIFLLQSKMA